MNVVFAVGLEGQALLAGDVVHALADQHFGFGVQRQFGAEGAGGALAGMVVGGGAYAAAGKHHVAAFTRCRKGAGQRGGDAVRIVAHVVGITELQAPRGQQFDGFGHVLVDAFAGKDFVADDDESEVLGHGV